LSENSAVSASRFILKDMLVFSLGMGHGPGGL